MRAGLETKVILITGAASGIGRAIARAASSAGAEALLLSDIDADGCDATAGMLASRTSAKTHIADLADPSAVPAIAQAAIAAFGRIDGLVNAAGLTSRAGFTDGTTDLWDRLFAINARAPFVLMQGAINDMLSRRAGGSIVNIQSVNAHCGTPDLAIYSASKGALQTLTRNAANAHLSYGIRVNGINLGWALTEAEHHMQSEVLGKGPDWAERAAANLPLGRLVLPDEVARLAVFLLSDASVPLTGVAPELDQRVYGAMW